MDFKVIEAEAGGEPRLLSLELGITSRCNFRCAYCCAYEPNEPRTLSGAQCIEILSGLPDLRRVKLSGGEVTLRFDDCLEVVRWCAARRIMSQINTNGTLLGGGRIGQLAAAGLDVLHVSLNYVEAAAHAAYYGVGPEMHGRIVAALREAAQTRVTTVVETLLSADTRDQLLAVHAALPGLGVRRHEIQMEVPECREGYARALPAAELAGAIGALLAHRHPDVQLYFSCLSAHFDRDDPFWRVFDPHVGRGVTVAHCVDGLSQLHVHATGEVLVCELGCPESLGNVFEEPLAQIYARTPATLAEFRRRRHQEGAAHQCFRKAEPFVALGRPRAAGRDPAPSAKREDR